MDGRCVFYSCAALFTTQTFSSLCVSCEMWRRWFDMTSSCSFAGSVALHEFQIQSEEEELQELWDCHPEPVQGDSLLSQLSVLSSLI